MAIKVSGNPPTFSVAWCASQNGGGNPIVTTTDGSSNAIVWSIGTGRLVGFDGDTGAVVFNGGGAAEALGDVQYWQPPIVAKGRIFIAGNGRIYAFKP